MSDFDSDEEQDQLAELKKMDFSRVPKDMHVSG